LFSHVYPTSFYEVKASGSRKSGGYYLNFEPGSRIGVRDDRSMKKASMIIIGFLTIAFAFLFLVPAFRGEILLYPDYYLGPLRIHMYSLTFFIAVVAGFFWVRKNAENFGINKAVAENLVFVNVIAGFLGARVHHILSAWDFYSANLILIPQIWRGGLGIYGGIVGGILATWIYCRVKKIDFFAVADLCAPALVLGQAIGRWGNFFNQEAYGLPTALPWKMFVTEQYRLTSFTDEKFFHPIFLYESLWALGVFLVLAYISKIIIPKTRSVILGQEKMSFGQVFGSYLILYSLGRFLIESLRADKTLFFDFPANQILALALIIIGLLITTRSAWKKKANQ